MHGPAATVVTVEPVTVHTDGVSELNDTGSPDDARADRTAGVPTVAPGGCLNVIVCEAWPGWDRVDLEGPCHVGGCRVAGAPAL